ncbi:MAG: hypothetical protein K0Q49_1435 [Haloplasmataceae bacterium]|nr:hypothetical protein [Haloplasmataceae bacterium]
MARKFEQKEIDLLYEKLNPDEEVLWRGKPRLVPNLSFLTSILLILLITVLFTGVVFVYYTFGIWYENWYLVGLILLDISIIIYIIFFNRQFAKNIINVFYAVTNKRLIIYSNKNNNIVFYKLFNTIKILNLKKTLFNTTSIIFDVEILNDNIKEIGFNNIENADEVFGLIKHQIQHTKNKE